MPAFVPDRDTFAALRSQVRDLPPTTHNQPGLDAATLKSAVDRIERLGGERDNLSADIREVFAEAKAAGFDTKILRAVIRRRRIDPAQRAAEDHSLELYLSMMEGSDHAP